MLCLINFNLIFFNLVQNIMQISIVKSKNKKYATNIITFKK